MNRTDPLALTEADLDVLLDGVPITPIPPIRAAEMWERIAAATAATAASADAEDSAFHVVRASANDWREILPGLRIKPLRVDAVNGSQTSLWWLEPGVAVPAHAHLADEECLIVEGTLRVDGKTYGPGDYLLAPAGGEHTDLVSPTGARFLIRGELNEPLRRLFAS